MHRHAAASKQHQQLDVKIYSDQVPGRASAQKPRASHPQAARHSKPPQSSSSAKEKPIIIVPEGYSSLVSLFNVKELLQVSTVTAQLCVCRIWCAIACITSSILQEGRFVQSEESAAVKAGEKKPDFVHVKRKCGSDRAVTFEVIDQEPRKGSIRWERVVAVICSGKMWQFKKYPFQACSPKSDPPVLRFRLNPAPITAVALKVAC